MPEIAFSGLIRYLSGAKLVQPIRRRRRLSKLQHQIERRDRARINLVQTYFTLNFESTLKP